MAFDFIATAKVQLEQQIVAHSTAKEVDIQTTTQHEAKHQKLKSTVNPLCGRQRCLPRKDCRLSSDLDPQHRDTSEPSVTLH